MSKELQIRNSTVDFLVFTRDAGEDGIEVRVQNGDVWLTQKAISQLFDVDRSVVTKHLSNIFKEGELNENSTCANFAQVADNGKTYNYKFYSLAAIIAVGYRINSERATQFRTWATKVLDTVVFLRVFPQVPDTGVHIELRQRLLARQIFADGKAELFDGPKPLRLPGIFLKALQHIESHKGHTAILAGAAVQQSDRAGSQIAPVFIRFAISVPQRVP